MYTDNFLRIAKIKKPFGNKGEFLIIPLSSFDISDLENEEWIFIDLDGDIVPFMIENIQHRLDETSLIKLKDIPLEKANQYTGLFIYLNKQNEKVISQLKNAEDSPVTFYELSGYKVIDKQKGEIGIVKDIIEKNVQNLLEIEYQNKQILIPIDKNIIKKIDVKNKTIHISAPEGLIDLYL